MTKKFIVLTALLSLAPKGESVKFISSVPDSLKTPLAIAGAFGVGVVVRWAWDKWKGKKNQKKGQEMLILDNDQILFLKEELKSHNYKENFGYSGDPKDHSEHVKHLNYEMKKIGVLKDMSQGLEKLDLQELQKNVCQKRNTVLEELRCQYYYNFYPRLWAKLVQKYDQILKELGEQHQQIEPENVSGQK